MGVGDQIDHGQATCEGDAEEIRVGGRDVGVGDFVQPEREGNGRVGLKDGINKRKQCSKGTKAQVLNGTPPSSTPINVHFLEANACEKQEAGQRPVCVVERPARCDAVLEGVVADFVWELVEIEQA